MRVVALHVLVVGLVPACSVDTSLPGGARVSCETDADCPGEAACKVEVGFCVAQGGEQTPPAVESVSLNRDRLGLSTPLKITFTVSEELIGAPEVTLTGGAEPIAVVAEPLGGLDWTVSYQPRGSETQGVVWTATTDLIDVAGNEAVSLELGRVEFDFVPPSIIVTQLTPPAVRLGQSATLDITVDEELDDARVTLDDGTELVLEASPAALVYRFRLDADGSQPEGFADATVRIEDLAANVNEEARHRIVRFDYGAPSLLGHEILSVAARAGMALAVRFDFSEPISETQPPVVELHRQAGGAATGETIAMDLGPTTPTSATMAYTVTAADPDGEWSVELLEYYDPAGNQGTPASVGPVQIDNQAPVLSNLQVSGGVINIISGLPTFSSVPPFDQLAVSFDIDEDVSAGLGALSATVSGTLLACTSYQASSPNHSCSTQVSGVTSALYAVDILVRDTLGNDGRDDVDVALDFDAPELYAATTTRPIYRAGDTVRFIAELDEPTDMASLGVTVWRNGTRAAGFFSPPTTGPTRTTLTFDSAQPLAPADAGAYSVELVATDDVGNQSGVLTLPGSAFDVDTSNPVITPVVFESDNLADVTRARPGDTITAVFTVDEEPADEPTVLVGSDEMGLLERTGAGPYTYTYDFLVTGGDGPRSGSVTATDSAGNVDTVPLGTITFDATLPEVVPGSEGLTLQPPPGAVATAVSRVTFGTTVAVSFTVSEDLRDDPILTLTPAGGRWDISRVSSSGTHWVFEIRLVGGTPSQAAHTVWLDMTDLTGHRSTIETLKLPAPDIVVDTEAPAPISPTQNDRVVYRRIPWGSSATPGSMPQFTVETATGQTQSVEANATVVIWDGADTTAAGELGRAVADGNGVFSAPLLRVDNEVVYLSQVDAAGNIDGVLAEELKNIEWVATMNGKVAGDPISNPHSYRLWPYFGERVVPATEPDVRELDGDAGMSEVGTPIVLTGQGRWEDRTATLNPPPRKYHAMSYDTARGRLVLFGGNYDTGNRGDTWEWDGSRWYPINVVGPVARNSHAMAYDAARGEVVLFGGTRTGGCDEGAGDLCAWTWTWNGSGWNAIETSGPTPRSGHAMAYDPVRHRVVLFGGDDDSTNCDGSGSSTCRGTWEWDGMSWTRVSTSGPSARTATAMAYDPSRAGVLLFGGSTGAAQTWLWNGAAWSLIATAGSIVGRSGHGMELDESRGRVVVFGGSHDTDCGEGDAQNCGYTWELNGSTWQTVATSGPAGRAGTQLAFDRRRGALVLYGGWDMNDFPWDCLEGDNAAEPRHCDYTWLLDGSTWRRTSLTQPTARTEAALEFIPSNNKSLLFGGWNATDCNEEAAHLCDDTWLWDGVGWQVAATSGPDARFGHGLGFFWGNTIWPRVALVGGKNDSSCDGGTEYCTALWLWCANCGAAGSWFSSTPGGTVPNARTAPILTTWRSGAVEDRIFYFGGYNDLPNCGEIATGLPAPFDYDYRCGHSFTLHWNGSQYYWTRVATTGPTAREAAGAAYDSTDIGVILFGGRDPTDQQDTWRYSGSTWSRRATSGPTARCNAALAYDVTRGRTIMFGGASSLPATCEGSTSGTCGTVQEWNGTTWIERPSPGPVRRSGAAVTYDEARARVVMLGGASPGDCGEGGGPYCGNTWELDNARDRRPAQVMSVSFAASGETPSSVAITSIEAGFIAGGRSRSTASCTTLVNGARVYLWDKGGWRDGGSLNAATYTTPASLSWTTGADTEFGGMGQAVFEERIKRLFFGRSSKSLNFAVASRATNGCVDDYARVTVDYAEVRVRYKRP